MSREQTFAQLRRGIWRYVVPVAIIGQAAATTMTALREPTVAPKEVRPQTANDPAPIFRCIGAGDGVVVSLGGDGESVSLFCNKIKS